jgi:bifunctional DNA-binding transcriptional regulator/antitoxin component of YhaV-PrlF toxin-antitoxin module
MSLITLDERGRLTLPQEIRSRIEAKRFIAYIENGEIKLTPLTDPKELKGSLKVAWSIEELEEEGDKYASKRT